MIEPRCISGSIIIPQFIQSLPDQWSYTFYTHLKAIAKATTVVAASTIMIRQAILPAVVEIGRIAERLPGLKWRSA